MTSQEPAGFDPIEEPEPERARYYGLTEIAVALDLDRQLVTAWRRRGSHAIPEPDAELSSGPIWRGVTIEPWIATMRARRTGAEVADLSPESAVRLARRLLRCAALALEAPVRSHLLGRSVADLRAALAEVAAADGPLADRARATAAQVEPHLEGRAGAALTQALVDALPAAADLVRAARSGPASGV